MQENTHYQFYTKSIILLISQGSEAVHTRLVKLRRYWLHVAGFYSCRNFVTLMVVTGDDVTRYYVPGYPAFIWTKYSKQLEPFFPGVYRWTWWVSVSMCDSVKLLFLKFAQPSKYTVAYTGFCCMLQDLSMRLTQWLAKSRIKWLSSFCWHSPLEKANADTQKRKKE